MHSSNIRQITDIRHVSPQTTSSSGYHSDLSSTNESPQSIHDSRQAPQEQSTSNETDKKTNSDKSSQNKNFSLISTFLRKQYERAKSKLVSKKDLTNSVTKCSKATSTTPLNYLSEATHRRLPQLSSNYKQSAFIQPSKIHSVYVHPVYDNRVKISTGNYASIHECFSNEPKRRIVPYSKFNNNNQIDLHPHNRLTTTINYESLTRDRLLHNLNQRYQTSYSKKPLFSQNYYPYRYLKKNYDFNRSHYAAPSDFIAMENSAFRPIKFHQRPSNCQSEQIAPSDDPCDLEVAQYFHKTPQWSNPNYFDVYTNEVSTARTTSPKKDYAETLC